MILHDGVHLKKFRQKRHIYPTYGTILPAGIDRLIADLQLTPSDVFYDLGSGIGNVCTQVFAQTPVRKCVGIEQIPDATPRPPPAASRGGACNSAAPTLHTRTSRMPPFCSWIQSCSAAIH